MDRNYNRMRLWETLTASLMLAVGVIGMRPAQAQSVSSFQVVGDTTPFDFSVNGTSINSATGANLNQYLNTGANSKNAITVGWNPPQQGSYIEMQYTGTGSYSFGSTTVTTGDYLHIYAIGGADLVNGTSIAATTSGSSLDYWSGTTATNKWSTTTNSNYVGYSSGWSSNDPFLAYNDSSTGVDGKSFAKAAKDGTFNFNGLTLGNSATYLGLDIYAQVFNSTDTKELSTASTGRISVESFVPAANVTPEGSSLVLITAGLLPLAWQGGRFLKRRSA